MFKYNVADMTTIICVDKISAIAVEFLTGALYMVSHHTHTQYKDKNIIYSILIIQ
jgi:hypothetical protein